jgi:class 3 adenylate cyclase
VDSLNRLPEDTRQGERRQATILFADLSGFTSLSETMDAEIVSGLMNEIYTILGKAVEDRGGVICRFIGDCLMALFGAPSALEHASWRALDAALEMRDRLHNFLASRNLSTSLDIHSGVNTGEVVSGTIGSESKQEYTVYGDAVNVASRLKDAAPKGGIYVGLQTHHETRDNYEYKAMQPIALKGKESPVAVYELLSRKGGVARGRMIFSPLVGRQKELDLLELQVLKAINGEGSVVHVIGEAGVGKSRLIAELRNKECLQRVTLLEGRAQSFGTNLSYHPIVDLLRKWAAIREEDGEAEAFRKLEKAIRSASPEEADETLPFIATLMGLPLRGKHAQRMAGIVGDTLAKLIMRTARDLLSRAAQRQALVIVLEDMHWADESTVEFVEYLFRLVDKDRVLFVNVFRPKEERGERLSKTARDGYGSRYVEVMLRPLDQGGCAELVSNLLKSSSVPPAIMESIISRTGGNPFFVEEVMRACIDDESVEVEKEGFRVTEKLQSFVVPATVNEVIMSRFDRLEEATRQLLRVASVIGRSFFYRILVQIAQGVGKIDEKIEGLKEMQIILERSRMEEVEYLFKHALAQESIYDSILLQVRKSLHLSVAQAVESIFAERVGEFAGMLALHYTRGEDYDKAEEYMIRAGEEALKAAGSSEALTYYGDALDLYLKKQGENADPAKVVMLKKNIARSLFYRGRYVEAIPVYDFVLRHYGILVPKDRLTLIFSVLVGFARIMFWLYGPGWRKLKPLTPQLREGIMLRNEKGNILGVIDTPNYFLQSFAGARQLLCYDLSDSEPGLRAEVGYSILFSHSGISLSLIRRVLEKLSRVVGPNLPGTWIRYLMAKSMLCYNCGEWNERELFRDSLIEKQSEQGNAFDAATLLLYSGFACIESGDWETYLDAQHMLEMVSDRFSSYFARVQLNFMIVRYYIKRRMVEEATDAIPGLLELFSHVEIFLFWGHAWATRVDLLRGDFESAAAHLNRIPNAIVESPTGPYESSFFRWAYAALAVEKARRAAEKGNLDRQTRHECLDALWRNLKNARKFAPDRTEALKFVGSYWWHAGSRRRALAYWKRSIREGERLGAKVELAHTFTDAGKLLGELAPGPEWRKRGAELYGELKIEA